MTKSQVKHLLNSYRHLRAEQAQIADYIARLEAKLTAPGAQNLDGMPRSGGSGDAMAEGVARLADLRDLYRAKERELAKALADIEHMIAGLEPIERQIVRLRYVDNMEWEYICVKVHYSWRQTHRIHSGLIDKLAKEG